MNNEEIVKQMIEYVKEVEKENSNLKYITENNAKKSAVNSILDELERLTNDED